MSSDKSKVARRMTDVDLSYLAGLIDGEGCFIITRKKPKVAGGRYYYHAKLCIGMAGPVIPHLHQKHSLGTVYWKKPQKDGYKGIWVWTLCKNDLWPILGRLIPLLIGKAVQATAVLEVYEGQGFHVGRGKGNVEHAMIALREANKKGSK